MAINVVVAEDPFAPETWDQTADVENLTEFLATHWEHWPASARLYKNHVSVETDVTPETNAAVDALNSLFKEGDTAFVVVYPEDPVTIVVAIISVLAAAAAAVFLAPAIPGSASRGNNENRQAGSPNNALANRENSPRVNGRIPDIYGTLQSTPDLLSVPYKLFVNHEEVEYSYMCVGRGSYEISQDKIKDDTTKIVDLAGTSVEVYGPYTSPNSGHDPQIRIGAPIAEPLFTVKRAEAINGQILRAPNANTVTGENDIYFAGSDQIRTTSSEVDFTDYFFTGDSLTIENAQINSLDLDGTYSVLSVSQDVVTLANPSAITADWAQVATLVDGITGDTSATLKTASDKWVGPFVVSEATSGVDRIFVNFEASNGLYKDNGSTQVKTSVTLEVEAEPVNSDGSNRGALETFQITLEGSATTRSRRATTLRALLASPGAYKVRARRITEADLSFNGTVVDDVKWRDVYSAKPVAEAEFGDVTTVQAITYATSGALSVKRRKLTMEVSRLIPRYNDEGELQAEMSTSNRFSDIFIHTALDNFIGRRTIDELDVRGICQTALEVETYFGSTKAAEFNYTFDSPNLSFEEIAGAIAGAGFCTAYRRGSTIHLSFEKATNNSTLLFNHRNKLPGAETRTITFGRQNDYDGVEYSWVDPDDDALVTMYVPEDGGANNPKKVESVGVRNRLQAYFHSRRTWQKINYQNEAVDFEATQEADLLVMGQRILVTDGTRPSYDEGELRDADGLLLTLSQPYKHTVPGTIFVQHTDGTLEALGFQPVVNEPYKITLATAPRLALSVSAENYARSVYQIVPEEEAGEAEAYLVTEKNPLDNFNSNVLAVNYDDRYYAHDTDLTTGVVDTNGYPV